MVKELIKIEEGIEVNIIGSKVEIKGKEGSVTREFRKNVKIIKEGDNIILEMKGESKRERRIIITTKKHIMNILRGVQKKFVYKLQICSVHFPITVTVDKTNRAIIIKNFLGEKKDRKTSIMPNADVKVEGDIVVVNVIIVLVAKN